MACRCKYRAFLDKKFGSNIKEKSLVYLDNNSTTHPDPVCTAAVLSAINDFYYNPMSIHRGGIAVYNKIESVRSVYAELFSCKPEEIFFAPSGTQAIYMVLRSLAGGTKRKNIISTVVEHAAVRDNVNILTKKGRKVELLQVDSNGVADLERLEVLCRMGEGGSVLIYSPVNHETGAIQPVKKIYEICRRNNVGVIMDGVQAASRLAPDEWNRFFDAAVVSPHKFYGLKGIGVVCVKNGYRLKRIVGGGGQEDGFFPGTQNTPGIMGAGSAAEILLKNHKDDLVFYNSLVKDLEHLLKKSDINYLRESPDNSCAGVINISLPEVTDMNGFFSFLYEKNIALSRFAACDSNVRKPSEILSAMGRDRKRALTSLRISFGRFNKREDIYYFISVLKEYFKIK